MSSTGTILKVLFELFVLIIIIFLLFEFIIVPILFSNGEDIEYRTVFSSLASAINNNQEYTSDFPYNFYQYAIYFLPNQIVVYKCNQGDTILFNITEVDNEMYLNRSLDGCYILLKEKIEEGYQVEVTVMPSVNKNENPTEYFYIGLANIQIYPLIIPTTPPEIIFLGRIYLKKPSTEITIYPSTDMFENCLQNYFITISSNNLINKIENFLELNMQPIEIPKSGTGSIEIGINLKDIQNAILLQANGAINYDPSTHTISIVI